MRGTSLVAGAVGGLLLACAAYAQGGPELPPGPNRDLVYGKCRTCHDLQYLVESAGVPRSSWSDLLDSMKQYGLVLASDERAKILDYLATYLGPHPPPKSASAPAPAKAAAVDGAKVFAEHCSACHQPNGQGVAGQFPPLAGNRDLFLSRTFPAMVALFGIGGQINVEGKVLDGVMPPVAYLSDAQIAAAINYVRGAWGNDKLNAGRLKPLDAATVADVRKKNLTPKQVYAQRMQLKAGAK